WESETVCETRKAEDCKAGAQLEGVTGVTDPAGCTTALMASCEAFLSRNMPDACKPTKGTLKSAADPGGDACSSALQCHSLYCYPDKVNVGCPGHCEPPSAVGVDCGTKDAPAYDFCDTINGQQCVGEFTTMAKGIENKNPTCEVITYGKKGDPCYDNTKQQ